MSRPDPRVLRLAGTAALLAGGLVHVLLAYDGYGTSTLQDMFWLNGIGSALVAVTVLALPGPVPAAAGAGVAITSLLALALSRVGDGVVGFRGTGLDPMPEVPITIVVEILALVLLGAAAVLERRPVVDLVRQARGRDQDREQAAT